MAGPTIHENYIVNQSFEYNSSIVYDKDEPNGSKQAQSGLWAELISATTGKGTVRLLTDDGIPLGPIVSVSPTKALICTVGTNLMGLKGGNTTTAATITEGTRVVGDEGTLVSTAEDGYLKNATDADTSTGREHRLNGRGSVVEEVGAAVGGEIRVNLP